MVFVGGDKKNGIVWEGLGFPLHLQIRTPAERDNGRVIAISRRFSSRGVVRLGMHRKSIEQVKKEAADKGTKNIADSEYLGVRTRPLLAVHMIAIIDKDTGEFDDGPPVTAWTIGFPTSKKVGMTVSYQVNRIWWQQNIGEVDEEIEEALDREE